MLVAPTAQNPVGVVTGVRRTAMSAGMFLELAKFVSLLLSILSLDALFHAAFMGSSSDLEQRLLPSFQMLLLAAAVCMGSGYIFRIWEQKTGKRNASLATSFPMQIFWWASGTMILLFALAWLLQAYFTPRWRT
jgi:hypothetical protein